MNEPEPVPGEDLALHRPTHLARPTPQVTILLCTFNGDRFLDGQLASILRQTHANWRLIASDDGSQDGTLGIFQNHISRDSRIELRTGPKSGASRNFMSLLTDGRIDGDYFALCDQDDVWSPDKLERAHGVLAEVAIGTPALYCSRTRLIASDGHHLGFSGNLSRAPCFANALVENIASGNTMVMNKAARDLFVAAAIEDVVIHDWWVYIIIAGAGGVIYYDRVPTVSYRQHTENLIGATSGLAACGRRARSIATRTLAKTNAKHIEGLTGCRHLLTAANRATLDTFKSIRDDSIFVRLRALGRGRFVRQTLSGRLSLIAATALQLA